MSATSESFFGIPLSTHRSRDVALTPFPYELVIAAISIAFFRTTIYHSKEPMLVRFLCGALLGYLAYSDQNYVLVVSAEIGTYAMAFLLFSDAPRLLLKERDSLLFRFLLLAPASALSVAICHFAATGDLFNWWRMITPRFVFEGLVALAPVNEVQAAYDVIGSFILEPGLLRYQVSRLLFITFHIQVGIGYLGIAFLKQEQQRRNELVRMDLDDRRNTSQEFQEKSNGSENSAVESRKMARSREFQRSAFPFIIFTAVPYMIQIIGYGNLNAFAYSCFKDDVHRAVRLYDLFSHDNHLVAVAEHSATSPSAYAGYMDTIVSTTYNLFNRKLFSLPKVLLLPVVMARQPKMMAQIFPIIFLADWCKGRAVSYMTNRIEQLQKDIQELGAMRSKVEAFDIKNAELLQRAGPGAIDFTGRRWEELTVQVQMKTIAKDLIGRTKGFFAWIERNFVFSVLVDCALAHLIAVGKLVAADIFVFSRAIEDAVDMVLMKSRSEAELARMMTQIDNMKELAKVWDTAKERNLLPCNVVPATIDGSGSTKRVVLRNLVYSRGTAVVRADHLELSAGIYALTGSNGSGKSTLFRVLMSCNTNERSIDLPSSIVLSTPFEPFIEEDELEREKSCESADSVVEETLKETEVESRELSAARQDPHPRLSITMPSSHIVEISQTFYWPLYSKPIDWIYQEHVSDSCDEEEFNRKVRRVAEELHSLEFAQAAPATEEASSNDKETTDAPSIDIIGGIMDQLVEVKEDWFNDLSGGQRSKVELVRKVFLQEDCPHVLLVDETMAPLDPRSKSLVMASIKSFCSNSVVIVIYHTDVGREQDSADGESVECVPSNDFFDGNIHVENQMLNLRPVC